MNSRTLLVLLSSFLSVCCDDSASDPEGSLQIEEEGDSIRLISIPGALTELEIVIHNDTEYTAWIHSDVGPREGLKFMGPANYTDSEITLWSLNGETIDLSNDGTGIYVRDDMDLDEAIRTGWCVSEKCNNEYKHALRIKQLVEARRASAMEREKGDGHRRKGTVRTN